ncbi:MAG: transporter substrate-binding domain-containing protein [Lachnospiraceae bacterium]
MKKKLLAILMTVCMLAAVAGCGKSDDASANASGVETVTKGKLTVATSPDFAPYEFYAIGEDGTPVLAGFDVALANYIANYMGLELEIVPMDFDGVLSELAMGNVDLGLAGLSPDPARADAMDFSDIYYQGGQSLVVIADNADSIQSFDDVNKPEMSVGAQIGSIQMDLANEYTPDADIVALPKVTDLISELIGGKLDAAFIETAVAESYKTNYPELVLVLDVPYDVEGSAVGIIKGNEALKNAVNEAIAAAIADGSMDRFVAEANEQASGNTYEGLLDENGNVQ